MIMNHYRTRIAVEYRFKRNFLSCPATSDQLDDGPGSQTSPSPNDRVQKNAFSFSHELYRIKACLGGIAVLTTNEFVVDLNRSTGKVKIALQQVAERCPPLLQMFVTLFAFAVQAV